MAKTGPQNNSLQHYAEEYPSTWKPLLWPTAVAAESSLLKQTKLLVFSHAALGEKSCRTRGQYNPAQKPNVVSVPCECSRTPQQHKCQPLLSLPFPIGLANKKARCSPNQPPCFAAAPLLFFACNKYLHKDKLKNKTKSSAT